MLNTIRGDEYPETMAELIADCSDIPASLRSERPLPSPREAGPWTVNEACLAQVHDLEMYV